MRVILAAGGTGGHLFPALALAEIMQKEGNSPLLFTDKRGQAYAKDIESRIIPASSFASGKIKAVINVLWGFFIALKYLRAIKPKAIVGFGGYVTFPVLLAARFLGIPFILHEQNAVMGRVNRFFAKKAEIIALSFANTLGGKAGILTGMPVRKGIEASPYPDFAKGFNLLIIGGSQGARSFSEVIPTAIAELPAELKEGLKITQQCRAEDLDQAREFYRKHNLNPELAQFFNDMGEKLKAAHLLIARAGASTLAELAMVGRPAILVPYPFAADNHQAANAQEWTKDGAGKVILQQNFTVEDLQGILREYLTNPDYLWQSAEAAKRNAKPQAAADLNKLVREKWEK